jgi:CRISPR-associated endonuclease/helicase Cas3
MTKFLLNIQLPFETQVFVLPYHSRFPLLVRNYIEQELDTVLKRKKGKRKFTDNIKQKINQTDAKNIIFVVVATPVEEVGRDHDFDWAVVEPSSIRSLVQMAGRVLRHQEDDQINLTEPNIIILDSNIRALQGKIPAYTRPGYECREFLLKSHKMRLLNIITQTISILWNMVAAHVITFTI